MQVAVPFCVCLSSGSAVSLPVMITLFLFITFQFEFLLFPHQFFIQNICYQIPIEPCYELRCDEGIKVAALIPRFLFDFATAYMVNDETSFSAAALFVDKTAINVLAISGARLIKLSCKQYRFQQNSIRNCRNSLL